MWTLISFILAILYFIWLSNLIKFGVTTATRIAVASEAAALSTAALYHALSPEAKARAEAYMAEQRQVTQKRNLDAFEAAKDKDQKKLILVAGIIVVIVAFAMGVGGFH
jgi:hypothetical protein